MALSHPDDPIRRFAEERRQDVRAQARDAALRDVSQRFLRDSCAYHYSYNFSWMGRPIIQYPADVLAMQEIVWATKPDLIIETGIAHGGSLVFYASLLALLGGEGRVVGVDVDIRAHNRAALDAHPMRSRIDMMEGSSIDPTIIEEIHRRAAGKRVMVALDSNHTHEHVLAELRAYAPLVSPGAYLVVFDTSIEDMPAEMYPARPWGPGNNPRTAVRQFLAESADFEVDQALEDKLLITVCPGGYLRRREVSC
ncbi:MAG: cephalosporin hydroxylase family protein [Polyangiaceae bacterium]